GTVIDQIGQEYLYREQWEKRQDQAGHDHADDVAKIGTAGHQDVFVHIDHGTSAFHYAVVQHAEIRLQQDDLRRRLGNIGRAVDRDADIRRVQRWRIVYAIAQKAHRLTGVF